MRCSTERGRTAGARLAETWPDFLISSRGPVAIRDRLMTEEAGGEPCGSAGASLLTRKGALCREVAALLRCMEAVA